MLSAVAIKDMEDTNLNLILLFTLKFSHFSFERQALSTFRRSIAPFGSMNVSCYENGPDLESLEI